MKKWLLAAGAALMLAACSSEDEPAQNEDTADSGYNTNENSAVGHGVEDGAVTEEDTVGYTLDEDGSPVAAEVPAAEEEALKAAYDEYIAAFNAEDLDRFMNVLAADPEGFDREEDRAALEEAFAQYDTTYTPSDVTVVKYEEDRAEVFAVLEVEITEQEADRSTTQSGRQVVVFEKENDAWKVSALHAIGNQ